MYDKVSVKGGYKKNKGGYKKNKGGYKKNKGGYKKNKGGYKKNKGGYKKNKGGYKKNKGGYKKNKGGYKKNKGGYKKNKGGYKKNKGGYKKNKGGYKKNKGGYKKNKGGYKKNKGGYKKNKGGPGVIIVTFLSPAVRIPFGYANWIGVKFWSLVPNISEKVKECYSKNLSCFIVINVSCLCLQDAAVIHLMFLYFLLLPLEGFLTTISLPHVKRVNNTYLSVRMCTSACLHNQNFRRGNINAC